MLVMQYKLGLGTASPYWITAFDSTPNDNISWTGGSALAKIGSTYYVGGGLDNDPILLSIGDDGTSHTVSTIDNALSGETRMIGTDSSNNLYTYIATGNNAYLSKFDTSFAESWTYVLEGFDAGTPVATCASGTTDAAGNSYLVGQTSDLTPTAAFIGKWNTSGTRQWMVRVDDATEATSANGVQVDGSGNVYVTTGDFATDKTVTVLKFNSAGSIQWQRKLSFATGDVVTQLNSLALTTSGDVILTCAIGSTAYLLRLASSTGTIIWQTPIQVANASGAYVDSSDNIYLTAVPLGAVSIVKYNSSGVLQWQRSLTAAEDIDGRLVVDGSKMIVFGELLTFDGGKSGSDNDGFIMALPDDGSLTGTINVTSTNSTTITYAASSYAETGVTISEAAGTLTVGTFAVIEETTYTMTSASPTITETKSEIS